MNPLVSFLVSDINLLKILKQGAANPTNVWFLESPPSGIAFYFNKPGNSPAKAYAIPCNTVGGGKLIDTEKPQVLVFLMGLGLSQAEAELVYRCVDRGEPLPNNLTPVRPVPSA
jgi:hypothetical protein